MLREQDRQGLALEPCNCADCAVRDTQDNIHFIKIKTMSKKIYNIKDKIAIEEFVFVVEASTEIISDIVSKQYSSDQKELILEEITYKWRHYIASYYEKDKDLYIDSDAIMNGRIKINKDIYDDLLFHKVRYIEDEYDSKNLKVSMIYKGTLLARHFLDKNTIIELQSLAEKCVSKLTSVSTSEYADRLENALLQLGSLHGMIIKPNNSILPEIQFWRELIMEESTSLMRGLQTKRLKKHSQRIRVLILNSLIKVSGIFPDNQENKKRFIAKVLDLDVDSVSTYLNDFVKDKMELKDVNYEKQIEDIRITCELLKSKGNDETDSNRVVKALVNHIELAGTPKYEK